MIDSQVAPASILQASQAGNCYQAALAYQQLNLSVLPLNGKRPALPAWSEYQFAPANVDAIRSWQRDSLFGNVGIICGKVSDNLVVVDFDGAGGYPAFVAMFPHLAETFTVATGGGVGKHVYLHVDRLPTTTRGMNTPIGHIELRSSGAYVVAAPSIHPVTRKPYLVEKTQDILRVPDLDDVAAWIKGFAPASAATREWKPPQTSSPFEGEINPKIIEAISLALEGRGYKPQREWLNGPCIFPERHKHGDRHPSFGFNTESAYGFCYVCGSIRAKDVCERLGLDPRDFGGLMKAPEPVVPVQPRVVPAAVITNKPAPPYRGYACSRLRGFAYGYI